MGRIAALGFRVKSGFAVAVALTGTSATPRPLARWIVSLSDPDEQASRQPYHAGLGTAQEDAGEIARLTRVVRGAARTSVAALLEDSTLEGMACPRAGLVVGSVIDPATVANPHIRAHASEGRLFRTALAEALERHRVACTVIVEKGLRAQAARTLARPAPQIMKTVTAFGDVVGGPWRAEEKAAAIAAWMML